MTSYRKTFSLLAGVSLILAMSFGYLAYETPPNAEAAFPGDYTLYQELEINPDYIGSNLSNFPVYVDLADLNVTGNDFWDTTNCTDIRVTESDGTTQVPVDIVDCDTGTNTGEMHFFATGTDAISSSATTTYRIWYNGTDTEPAADSTYGSQKVWDTFTAVWHFQTDGSDSSATGNNLSEINTPAYVTGKVGGGVETVQTDEDGYTITHANQSGLKTGGDITYAVWANVDVFDVGEPVFITDYLADSADRTHLFRLDNNGVSNNRISYAKYDTSNNNTSQSLEDSSIVGSSWLRVVLQYDQSAGEFEGFINGASIGTSTHITNPATDGTSDVSVLTRNGNGQFSDGTFDEFRVSHTIQSTDWIAAEYDNQNTPTPFYFISTEQSGAGGGGGGGSTQQDIIFFQVSLNRNSIWIV